MKSILKSQLEGPVKSLFGGGGGGGGGRQESRPQDLTPEEFAGLRPGIAQQFQNLFASGGGPAFSGQFAAPVTGSEQQLLQGIQQQAMQPTGTQQASQDFLQQLISGQTGQAPAGLDFAGMQGGTPTGQENPFLAGAIEAAQRPLVEQFQDITAPALRAQFTGAGQQIQGQGSSPFQMAAARAQSGLANAMGDIGARLAFQDLSQRQQLGSQEFQQMRDLALGQRGQDIQQQQVQQQQQLEGVSQAAGIERQQLENMMSALEAQALPRMVEQFGIDRGLEEFRRRQDQLLQAIQSAGALASPTVGQISTGTTGATQGQNPNFGPAIGAGLAAFFGG